MPRSHLSANLIAPARLGLALAVGVATMASLAQAQVPDWQLNRAHVVGDQQAVRIVETPVGDLVMVWSGVGADSDESAIVMRRFEADGTPLDATEQLVNVFTDDDQSFPDVAIDSGGELIVVWEGRSAADGQGIVARRLAADGTPLSGEIQVNSNLTTDQFRPRVARAAGGEFAVAWLDLGLDQVRVRLFDATGTPLTDEIGLDPSSDTSSIGYDLAYAPSGELVVVWDHAEEIFQQRFSALGVPVAAPVSFAPVADANQHPTLAMAPDGSYLVVWSSRLPGRACGQLFSATDQLVGSHILLDTTPFLKTRITVVAEAGGGFRAVWESGSQPQTTDLFSRRTDATGQPLGTAEELATGTTFGYQHSPHLAARAGGGSVLVWTGPDQDGFGVFTDMPTTAPLFCDGFESGDTTRWYQTSAP